MIYELRTYTLKPGTQPDYLRANKEIGREVRGDRFGTLIGAWTTETGGLNQYVHLWSYPSPDERERLRAALAKDERWTKEYVPVIRPMMVAQENMLLTLDGDIGSRSVEGTGHVYEMRTYRAYPGQIGTWASLLKEALPAREQYSKIVGLWNVEVGPLNTAVHIWAYDDLKHRAEVRAAALQDPAWKAFVPKGSACLAEMKSTILIPTEVSPLR